MTRYLGCFYIILMIAGGVLITDLYTKLPFLAACGAMLLVVFIQDRKATIKKTARNAVRDITSFLRDRSSGTDQS